MKNTNALQIFSILSVIVIIILGVALIMMNNGQQKLVDETKSANDKAAAANKEKETAVTENLRFREMLGYVDMKLEDINKEFTKDFANDKTEYKNSGKTNYRQVVSFLDSELKKKNEEHKNTVDSLNKITADYDNLHRLYDTVLKKNTEEKQKAVDDLANARKDFAGNLSKQKQEMEVIKSELDRTKTESEQQIKEETKKAEDAVVEAKQINLRNEELTGIIADIRRDSFERPSGKIISINQKSGVVIIDLGSEDGLATRMTFSVYNPKITGIAFGAAKAGEETQICEVCKRELKQNASKASIEVVKILGPHKSEARILDDELSNPIVAGDVIHTPIWKPGQHQRFALASGMRLPGIENRDGNYSKNNLEAITRLIKANGGIVDAYICDGSDKEHKRGEVVGKITSNTTYLVIGDLDEEDQGDQDIMKAQSEMEKEAKRNAVKQISLRDLLTRMAYKNTTPVRGFGKYAGEGDHRLIPTGENRPSNEAVSPLYQLPNNEARVTIKDRTERPSTGTVSGLYNETKTTAQSTGSVSELFRQRKPGPESSAPKVEDEKKSE